MKFYILQMKANGIKNISKEIVLNFYNKTFKPEFDLNDSNIKSIYGPNGSGKSGLINAIDIYQKLITRDNYLSDSTTLKLLDELINKKSNRFSIETSFLFYEDDGKRSEVYTHRIEIEKDKAGYWVIAYEKLLVNKSNAYDNDRGRTIIEIENGNVVNTAYAKEYKEIEKYVLNLLVKQSVVTVIWKRYDDWKETQGLLKYYLNNLLMPLLLCWEIDVVVNQSDEHYEYIRRQKGINFLDAAKASLWYSAIKVETDIVSKMDFETYKENISKLQRFIKIFKPNLQGIEVESKEDSNFLLCEKYFCYDGYRVHSEFESTGIKKLIELFNAFCNVTNGKIVFIDELDANLHDVYLCKLIEYFSMYAKGQLCFTTHNLTPMEVLKKRNYSIDFLSDESMLTSWKKNGNSSVSKYYREGMIQNSPFNIEAFDFIGLFEED